MINLIIALSYLGGILVIALLLLSPIFAVRAISQKETKKAVIWVAVFFVVLAGGMYMKNREEQKPPKETMVEKAQREMNESSRPADSGK